MRLNGIIITINLFGDNKGKESLGSGIASYFSEISYNTPFKRIPYFKTKFV